MKKQLCVALGTILLLPMFAVQAQGPGAGAKAAATYSPRAQLVHDIVLKWAPHVKEAYHVSPSAWARGMQSTFANADIKALESAAIARNYDVMTSRLLGPSKATANGISKAIAITPEALGDEASDLVFVPVTPCRVFDTRLAGGVIAANTVRSFDITAISDYSSQGGAANDCGGAGAAGSFAAAMINFTVVSPTADGWITTFPYLATQPLAASVNYKTGAIVGNVVTVKLDQGADTNELSVYSKAQTHLVGDIVGYFTKVVRPALALECVEVASAPATIAAGATANVFSPSCAAGYSKVEVQCRPSSFGMRVAGSWTDHCNMANDSASSATVVAAARCCRVPAR